jgi:hypothetical protein
MFINIAEDPLPDHVTNLKTVLGLISTPSYIEFNFIVYSFYHIHIIIIKLFKLIK